MFVICIDCNLHNKLLSLQKCYIFAHGGTKYRFHWNQMIISNMFRDDTLMNLMKDVLEHAKRIVFKLNNIIYNKLFSFLLLNHCGVVASEVCEQNDFLHCIQYNLYCWNTEAALAISNCQLQQTLVEFCSWKLIIHDAKTMSLTNDGFSKTNDLLFLKFKSRSFWSSFELGFIA